MAIDADFSISAVTLRFPLTLYRANSILCQMLFCLYNVFISGTNI